MVCLRKKWGDCHCCSQKGFYSIQVEELKAGEAAQRVVEEASLSAAVFSVRPQRAGLLSVGVKGRVPRLLRTQSLSLWSAIILQAPLPLFCMEKEFN